MDDYLTEFVQESEERIEELNTALVALEDDPDDEDALNRIFRTAHTLKGNAGAMGFDAANDVAHVLEEMLDAMRAGELEVTADRMDLLFDAVDALDSMVDEIAEHGEPRFDPTPVVEPIESILEETETVEPSDADEASDGDDEPVTLDDPGESEIDAAVDGIATPADRTNDCYHVRLAVDETERATRIDGMLVLEALADAFDVLGTVPAPELIQEGKYDESFDAVIASAIGRTDIAAALQAVDQVHDVVVTDVTDRIDWPAEANRTEDPLPVDSPSDDVAVDELLDEFDEFEDIEGIDPDQVADVELGDDLGDAGTFEDATVESEPDDPEIDDTQVNELIDDIDEPDDEGLDPSGPISNEPKDTSETFAELQDEVDQVGYDELQEDLEELEFEELQDQDDEVGFDELVEGDVDVDGAGGDPDDLGTFGSEFDEGEDDIDTLVDDDDGGIEFDDGDDDIDDIDELVGDDTDEEIGDFDELVGGEADSANATTDDGAADDPFAEIAAGIDDDDELEDSTDELNEPEQTMSGSDTADVSAGDSGTDRQSKPSEASSSGEIQTIRVDVGQLDELYNRVEELVTSRIRLRRAIEEHDTDVGQAIEELDELETVSERIQDTVMDVRLVPLEQVTGRLPRVVRDIAREQEKEVDFEMAGTDVELDRSILDEIGDSLIHLIRNAVDHGIESPDEREAAGKPREGTVELRAEQVRDRVMIEISDDGSGLDADELRELAIEQELCSPEEAEAMDDGEIHDLIFQPGFTTTSEVTDVSGRGVGMDVVRQTVTGLDGSVEVESEPGEGTTVRLRLPVSIATVRVLFVSSGEERYGVPIKSVDEITRVNSVERVEGEEVYVHGDQVYPLVRLGEALDVPGETRNGDGRLIRVADDVRQVALHCDEVVHQEEVVVKPFEGLLSGIPGLTGATVLGEGDIVPILDVESL